jgi:hypothetical protein
MTAPYVPFALTLSLLIYAERLNTQGEDGLEHATYIVLDRAADLVDWSEDRRADLYARIVEALPVAPHVPFTTVQSAVTKAILEHNRTWQHC